MKKSVSSGNINTLYKKIKTVLNEARNKVYQTVNFTMVEAYWNIGHLIVEEEQKGKTRAEYGVYLIEKLSGKLTNDFGKGFDPTNLSNMRKFYLTFPILDAVRQELTWTHYRILLRVEDTQAREFYMRECIKSNWSTRQLERQINSFYYQRLLVSKNKQIIKKEAEETGKSLKESPENHIKDPYILEFLGLQDKPHLRESEIEQSLISHLQKFLLELGRGFSFVARQQRISTETQDFYIDLVFFNYILNCFVLIDLKIGKLTHQDIGQVDMYVRMFEDLEKPKGTNPTIGIILCSDKDETMVRYSVLKESKQLFASKYKLYLPTKEELKREIEKDRMLIEGYKK